jgi:hypothetical protein
MDKNVYETPSKRVLFWVAQNKHYQKMHQARRKSYEWIDGNLPNDRELPSTRILAPIHLQEKVRRLMA